MRHEPHGRLDGMPTLVKDPPPAGFEELLERRRELGQDLLDEVWEGVYHVNPAPAARHAGSPSSSRCGWTRRPARLGSCR